MKKIALSVAALVAAFITFASPAQAHCQPGYNCWAHSRHYGQRWSYGPRYPFQPSVTYGQHGYQRHYQGQHLRYRGTIAQKRTVATATRYNAPATLTRRGGTSPNSQALSVYYDQSAGAKTVTGVRREQNFGWAKYYDQ